MEDLTHERFLDTSAPGPSALAEESPRPARADPSSQGATLGEDGGSGSCPDAQQTVARSGNLLSTGLRREELLNLNLDQLVPTGVAGLRQARQRRLTEVKGKGGTERTMFFSADARLAHADYLETERPRYTGEATSALFVTATGIPARAVDGRLSLRSVHLTETFDRL
jgi:integrase